VYVITTTSTDYLTAIRIEFDDDAKEEAVRSSKLGESMLERCCWRLIYNRRDEVSGDSVTFSVSRKDVIELIWQLREVDGQMN
jgi:hypothetical protein